MNLLWGTFSDLEGWLHGGRQENVTNSSYTNNLHHQLVSLAKYKFSQNNNLYLL